MPTASALRAALLTPYDIPAVRGNAITVRRIAAGLTGRGVAARVFGLDRLPPPVAAAGVRAFRPDIVHAFHATAAGPLALACARDLGVPAVVTLTGTDVNHDLADERHGPTVRRVLTTAAAVVVFHAGIRDRVCRELPALARRIHVIGQAVDCPAGDSDLRGRLGLGAGAFLFLQTAGVRRVKNLASVFPPLTALQQRHPHVRYALAGPILEPDEGVRLETLFRSRPWAAFLGAVPHAEVSAMLRAADAAINSSLSEGGMSNAVLEAMSQGVPVLASDIEGNRSVITDGEDGLLYASEEEFLAKATRLVEDVDLRRRLGERARRTVAARFPPAAEIDGHLRLYHALRGTRGEGVAWT